MGDITHFLDDVTRSHPFKKRTGTNTWNSALISGDGELPQVGEGGGTFPFHSAHPPLSKLFLQFPLGIPKLQPFEKPSN
jgi:hypothetical protein